MLLCASSSGNPSPTLISGEKRISLQCLHNYMLLDMDLQDIPGLEPASLHLRHFSCKPYQVLDTRAIFRVPFQGCGTTRESNSDYIVYENVVDNSKESNATRVLIRHAQELRYPFSCRYRQKYFLILQEGQSGKRGKMKLTGGTETVQKKKFSPKRLRGQRAVCRMFCRKFISGFFSLECIFYFLHDEVCSGLGTHQQKWTICLRFFRFLEKE
ncbi:Zona pellucida (ZP) domain [Porites harrisoni]